MQRKTHHIKVVQQCFDDIHVGGKRFEVRRDDRGYGVDDMLVLRETVNGKLTGRIIYALVNYIWRNTEQFQFLVDGYVVLGIDIIRICEVSA